MTVAGKMTACFWQYLGRERGGGGGRLNNLGCKKKVGAYVLPTGAFRSQIK